MGSDFACVALTAQHITEPVNETSCPLSKRTQAPNQQKKVDKLRISAVIVEVHEACKIFLEQNFQFSINFPYVFAASSPSSLAWPLVQGSSQGFLPMSRKHLPEQHVSGRLYQHIFLYGNRNLSNWAYFSSKIKYARIQFMYNLTRFSHFPMF